MAPETSAVAATAPGRTNAETKIRTGSLVIVSVGPMAVNHVTVEAEGWIRHADKVFCWDVDPVTKRWIAGLNGNLKSLDNVEALGKQALEAMRAGFTVCAVHAGDTAAWCEEIRISRAEGLHAVIVPGVSPEDCLFSDLEIDPLRDGVQIYRATDFLAQRRVSDVYAGLVLRLADCVEDSPTSACDPSLIEMLTAQYGKAHEAILYAPARYAVCQPLIRRCGIEDLAGAAVTAYTSLYVPPKGIAPGDREGVRLTARDPDKG